MNSNNHDLGVLLFSIGADTSKGTSQEEVFTALRTSYADCADWYLREKRKKSKMSKLLRFISILMFTIGSAVPLSAPIFPTINPYIGYAILAAGGASQLIDKHLGFTAAWGRCLSNAMEINRCLLLFQTEWWGSRDKDTDEKGKILHRYADKLGTLLATETATWAEVLTSRASELDAHLDRQSNQSAIVNQ